MQKQTDDNVASSEIYPNPPFREEDFLRHYERWKCAVGEKTLQEEGISEDLMRRTCETICTKFPRGKECGMLLWEPVVDDTPLDDRGVSLLWMYRFWAWMKDDLGWECNKLPTRLFVAIFVEPLVLGPTRSQQQQQGVLPLYFLVPIQFCGKPHVFLSHGWDSWLRHLLYWPCAS